MINIYNSQITDVMPDYLKTDCEVQAISFAISNQIKKIKEKVNIVQLFHTIDILPDKILDVLAIEFRTQYYDETLESDIKSDLIKNSLAWYLCSGTPAVVEEVVSTLLGDGTVKEWFDYDGEPYKFYLDVNPTKLITEDKINKIDKMIDNVKNCRSWMEVFKLHLHAKSNNNSYLGSTLVSAVHYILTSDFNTNYDSDSNEKLATTIVNTNKYTLTNDINKIDESISKANQASSQSISLHYELS